MNPCGLLAVMLTEGRRAPEGDMHATRHATNWDANGAGCHNEEQTVNGVPSGGIQPSLRKLTGSYQP